MSNFKEKRNEIQNITDAYVNKLHNMWTEMFNSDSCNQNMGVLVQHVTFFYEELVKESIDKKESIQAEIKRLHDEAANLKRLLNVDLDISSTHDKVPFFDQQTALDKSLNELRECLRKRKDQIYELLLEQEALCEELSEPSRCLLDDPLPSEDELTDFRLHLEKLKGEKVNRQYEISTTRREIKNLLQALEISVQTQEEESLLNDRHISLAMGTLNRLNRFKELLSLQMEEVRESIDSMRNKLQHLWERLEVSPSIRNKFSKYSDYSQTTYDKLYQELDRCETLKRQNIQRFVDKIREEIVLWWDKTLKSDVERSRFSNFTNDCYTDDLLSLHEMELDDLKRHYNQNEQIFELINERKTLWDRMAALEAKASEPGRYNNRGGQLLKEEKERKTIATKLPKIESQLTELVHKYQEEHCRSFLVFGEDVLEILSAEWEKKRSDKEKLSSARKQGQTPLSKTILGSRTPMSARNASVRKAPSTTNLSSVPAMNNKRKIVPDDHPNQTAKRSLMTAFGTPNLFLKPTSSARKTPFKSPLKKPRVIGSTIVKRRSTRKSGGLKKRKSAVKTPKKMPEVVITDVDASNTEPDSYDSFQQYMEMVPAARSSIIQNIPSTRNRNIKNPQKENGNLPNPRLFRTPSKANLMEQQSISNKSPGLSRTANNSPLPSSSRKLTTKNLPILI